MKKQILLAFFATVTMVAFTVSVAAQAVLNSKIKAGQQNFYQIQKAFYDSWKPYHVVNGYYYRNGKKIKARGWKQFKRWEWYWENRVDPQTGAFPGIDEGKVFEKRKISSSVSRSSTGNWTSLGPSTSPGGYEGIGRINCVAFHPSDNNTWWIGSPSGGLWVTADNGATWNVLTDNNEVLGISDIAVSPDYSTSHTLYIATGDRDGGSLWSLSGGQHNDNNSVGVLKSTDGGTTWSETGLTFNPFEYVTVNRLLINPQNYNTVIAAYSNGIALSHDGGDSWSYPLWGEFVDMEYKPGDTTVIYAATKDYWGTPIIYKSSDGGANWTSIKTFAASDYRVELAVTAANSQYLYAVVAKTDRSLEGVYRSTDGGATFTEVYDGTASNHNLLGWKTDGSDAGGQGGYDLAIAVSPTDANDLYVGGINVHRSTDGGTSWTAVTCWTTSSTYNKNNAPEVHADHHVLNIRSGDGTLFDGNDGGIYITTDNGTSWTDKTNGIVVSQMYRLGINRNLSSEILTGLQDNGTKLLNAAAWSDVKGGDGMECIIDYNDHNIQYAATPNGDIARTTDHWTASVRITQDYTGSPINGLTETGSWVTPYVIDPANHETLYLGLENVWKSTDKGDSWTKISTMNCSGKLRSLAVAHSDNQVIIAAGQDSVWKTTDGGSTWSNITGSLPTNSCHITYVAVKYTDESTIWVSLGEYSAYGVFESTDGGATWHDISTGLPAVPVMCVVQNRQNTTGNELYAATDLGVYARIGNSNWFSYNNSLPNVVVTELEIYYDDGNPSNSRLRAATYGRGLWESDLWSASGNPPATDFVANDTTPNIGATVSFTDKSTEVPTSWLWSFSPNDVTYVDGTSNISENPKVQFGGIGKHTVVLTATNNAGSNTKTKTNYIDVGYCDANGWENSTSYIKSVTLLDINNTGTGSDGYKDYTSLSTDLHLGYTYFITVENGNSASQNDDLGVWVDWNEDGDFNDAGENIVCSINNYADGTFSFQVPSGTAFGTKRMRLRIKTNGSDCGSPCGDAYEGEVEDYTVNVTRETLHWTGNNSDDWNDTGNWDLGVLPSNNYDVVIPSSPGGGIFPQVKEKDTAVCHKLKLENGASITVNGTLKVAVDN